MTIWAPDRSAAQDRAGTQDRKVKLSWSVSAHARRLLTFALAGLIVAVITHQAAFAAAAGPAVVLLTAWRRDRPAHILVGVRSTALRVNESEQAAVIVTITGTSGFSVDLLPRPADAVEMPDRAVLSATEVAGDGGTAADGDSAGHGNSAGHGAATGHGTTGNGAATGDSPATAATLPFRVRRWGRRRLGTAEVILRDPWRLLEGKVTVPLPMIDCYPEPAVQGSKVVLSRLPNWLGEHSSRAAGAGTDFTGVRDFVPGDAQRRINWPATTRRGRLQLNMFAAERTQNVVIIVDATSDVGEAGATSIDLALRGAAGPARASRAARDRVGFISYASGAAWIAPGSGSRQFHRIMSAMLAEPGTGRQGELDRLPKAALPSGALIVVFSPLLSLRLIGALRDLRERGFSVLIVDVLNAEPVGGNDSLAAMTRRVWRMEQEAIRFSLRELGIPVIHWDGKQPLDEPLAPYTRRVMVGSR
jgi:uncharacterized protein (DUF58 family)